MRRRILVNDLIQIDNLKSHINGNCNKTDHMENITEGK
jgi:hypothetical protein